MSVLCVIATMMRPWPSAMARKSAWGLSLSPLSRVAAGTAPLEKMLGTWVRRTRRRRVVLGSEKGERG